MRVGAIARYGALEETRTVGYRHWCYSDERVEDMDRPSYMMALKLTDIGGAPKGKGVGNVSQLLKPAWKTPKATKIPKYDSPLAKPPTSFKNKKAAARLGALPAGGQGRMEGGHFASKGKSLDGGLKSPNKSPRSPKKGGSKSPGSGSKRGVGYLKSGEGSDSSSRSIGRLGKALVTLPPDKKRRKKGGLLHKVLRLGASDKGVYHLVVEHDATGERCQVLPLYPAGEFNEHYDSSDPNPNPVYPSGEFNQHSARRGRCRYRLSTTYGVNEAELESNRQEVYLPDCLMIPADMVGKTAEVAKETWDIFDDLSD